MSTTSKLWERQTALNSAEQALAKKIADHQSELRSGSAEQRGHYSVQDIVLSLYGKVGIARPGILKAWQGLRDRFNGQEGQPYLVFERKVDQDLVSPCCWLGTIPEYPFDYISDDWTSLRSLSKFTITRAWADASGSRLLARDEPRATESQPLLTYRTGSGRFLDGKQTSTWLHDRVSSELDVPIGKRYSAVSADFRPYYDLQGPWRRPAAWLSREVNPDPLLELKLLEIAAGATAIEGWIASNPLKGEVKIVQDALEHQTSYQRNSLGVAL